MPPPGDTRIKTLLPHVPRLQRGARNLQRFGGLTLGDPLGLQSAILVEQGSAVGAIPSLMTIILALVPILEYSAHSDLLPIP